ncbi:MAG: PCMD domain-containing protein [Bacteroidales bacterium]|jgi:hypothetical protein|nr:PCMD domain-containing protein [Bacteroidales bacterium]
MKHILCILSILLLFNTCTKVTDLSDKAELTAFNILSVTPPEIELGTPVINKDTIEIPVLRGVSLFPMSISASPEISPETERAVPGTSFSSFDDIKFDLGDIQFNRFYLVAKSGQTKSYYIKLGVLDQDEMNDFKKLVVTGHSSENAMVAPNAFINPIKRTVEIYATGVNFPVEMTAVATLSDHAYIKDENNTLDKELLAFSFNNYDDGLKYTIEAENGAVQEWKLFLRQTKEITGNETSDIRSAVSLTPGKQKAIVKTDGYDLSRIDISEQQALLIFNVASRTRSMNLELVPELAVLANSQIIGYTPGESLFFDDFNTTKDLIILDSRTGYYRRWKLMVMRSDDADIYRFPFTYRNAASAVVMFIKLDTATVIDNINKALTFNVNRTQDAGSKYWPLTVTPNADKLKLSEGATVDAQPLIFNDLTTIQYFTVTSASGVVVEWSVKLRDINIAYKADIERVEIMESSLSSLSEDDIAINTTTAEVFIDLDDKNQLPLRIQPYLHISDGATFESFQNGDFMEFRSLTDITHVNIISGSGTLTTWKFRLADKAQLPNSDFELWINDNGLFENIDPVPGKGRGWCTANNFMVQGTRSVANGNGLAAEMTTDITKLPENLITSGSLFLGYFDMSTITLEEPRKMTKFGIPFDASPTAIALDAKYVPGALYQKSRKVSGSGVSAKYVLDNLSGEDRGQIWVELIYWEGPGDLNYNGEPVDGVHVLARGEKVMTTSPEMSRITIPIERNAKYDLYTPTHFVVVMASSIEGHLFIGAKDSKLTVDNFELIY